MHHIEVETRIGPVALTPSEWLMAHRLGEEYWLYIVENAASHPVLHRIRNPAVVLWPEEQLEAFRCLVRDWRPKLVDDA